MKSTKIINRFQSSVDYLTEYSGVIGAVVCDDEGLIIAKGGAEAFDAESYAALGLTLVTDVGLKLKRLIGPEIEYVVLKTGRHWLTIAKSSNMYLIVAADRHADDLLNIRITRSIEMITSFVKEKYPSTSATQKLTTSYIAKNMEDVHV